MWLRLRCRHVTVYNLLSMNHKLSQDGFLWGGHMVVCTSVSQLLIWQYCMDNNKLGVGTKKENWNKLLMQLAGETSHSDFCNAIVCSFVTTSESTLSSTDVNPVHIYMNTVKYTCLSSSKCVHPLSRVSGIWNVYSNTLTSKYCNSPVWGQSYSVPKSPQCTHWTCSFISDTVCPKHCSRLSALSGLNRSS